MWRKCKRIALAGLVGMTLVFGNLLPIQPAGVAPIHLTTDPGNGGGGG